MRAVQPDISTGGRSSVTIRSAMEWSSRAAGASGWASTIGIPASPSRDTAGSMGTVPTSGAPVSAARRLPPPEPKIDPPVAAAPRRLPLASALALLAANLVPLAGVLLWGWKLHEVIVLFWAESAVIGFYTLLKMAVVGKWLAIFAGVFFAGHFGGFMAIHFFSSTRCSCARSTSR